MGAQECEVTSRSIQMQRNALLLLSFLGGLWGGSWQRQVCSIFPWGRGGQGLM